MEEEGKGEGNGQGEGEGSGEGEGEGEGKGRREIQTETVGNSKTTAAIARYQSSKYIYINLAVSLLTDVSTAQANISLSNDSLSTVELKKTGIEKEEVRNNLLELDMKERGETERERVREGRREGERK